MWAVDHVGGPDGWAINLSEQPPGAVPLTFVPMSVKVLDADGKVVWDGVVDRQTSVQVQPGAVKRPLKAVFLAAKDVKDVVVPLEIKDMPVPPAR